ncbi:MAG: endonuclease/exonuclease/phosphatase family protein [Gammaproteobacteria bacterium]|nr:endonuclease/exonuclease/phosphatase family protein [Gammaproteobacteria bacterium]
MLQLGRQFALFTATLSLVVAGGLSLLALFARYGWIAELVSHFRLQYAVVLVALVGGFAITRRPYRAFAAGLFLLPNAWFAGPYLLPGVVTSSAAAAAAGEVSIVALNLFVANSEHAAVRAYLRHADADILVLSELTPAWVSALREVTAAYPYWVSVDRRTPWGLGVYSRFPLKGARALDLGLGGSVNVVATAALPGGDVQLVGVHLASPTSPARAAQRNLQLQRLADLLGPPRQSGDARNPPRLLIGDMNITPFSPYFGDLLDRTGLIDRRARDGLLTTWPTWFMPVRIPIDHCIADPDLPVLAVRRGPAVGSDHYPLEIRLHRRS